MGPVRAGGKLRMGQPGLTTLDPLHTPVGLEEYRLAPDFGAGQIGSPNTMNPDDWSQMFHQQNFGAGQIGSPNTMNPDPFTWPAAPTWDPITGLPSESAGSFNMIGQNPWANVGQDSYTHAAAASAADATLLSTTLRQRTHYGDLSCGCDKELVGEIDSRSWLGLKAAAAVAAVAAGTTPNLEPFRDKASLELAEMIESDEIFFGILSLLDAEHGGHGHRTEEGSDAHTNAITQEEQLELASLGLVSSDYAAYKQVDTTLLTWPVRLLEYSYPASSNPVGFGAKNSRGNYQQKYTGQAWWRSDMAGNNWVGRQTYRGHYGIDIVCSGMGLVNGKSLYYRPMAQVIAAQEGVVVAARADHKDECGPDTWGNPKFCTLGAQAQLGMAKNWQAQAGNFVIIEHVDSTGKPISPHYRYTLYCHLQKGLNVQRGQRVGRGQLLGYIGSSGNSTGPHLHFEVGQHVLSFSTKSYSGTGRLGFSVEPFLSRGGTGGSKVRSLWQDQCSLPIYTEDSAWYIETSSLGIGNRWNTTGVGSKNQRGC